MGNLNGRSEAPHSYRCILDTVPNAIIEVGTDLIISLANSEAFKWFPEIVEGKSYVFDVLVYEKEKPGAQGIIEKTFALKRPQTAEIGTKDGVYYHLKTNYVIEGGSPRVIVHILDITGRLWAEKALRKSQEQYRLLFESAPDAISILDTKGNITMCNRMATQLYGYTRDELIGKHMTQLMRPSSVTVFHEKFQQLQRLQPAEGELQVIKRNGMTLNIWRKEVPLSDENGKFMGVLGYDRDITERKRAEVELRKYRDQLEELVKERTNKLIAANEELQQEISERKRAEEELIIKEKLVKASLEEKEVLLKEIHHRVKNNLQIISSLLSLQSSYIEDEKALSVFKNCRERVRTMGLVHEELYRSSTLSRIDFREYIKRLTRHLFDSYSLNPGQVNLKVDVQDVYFDIETTIPLGLIINELITNTLKYAFPGGRRGELRIRLQNYNEDGYPYLLVVSDDGVGLPSGIDFSKTDSLGMMLVNTLVKQLRGILTYNSEDGTTFTIKFNKVKPKKNRESSIES